MQRFVLVLCLMTAVTACGNDPAGDSSDADRWINPESRADAGDDARGSGDVGGAGDTDSADDAGDAGSDATGDAGLPEGVVMTEEGPVQGDEFAGVTSFFGVPYAKPPVGELRWKAPRPPEPRSETLQADSFGPACPQPRDNANLQEQSEDCLKLNVWAPGLGDAEPKPVMVWLHGGGFVGGSSRQTGNSGRPLFDGEDLARNGVVVVTLDYRLGALGFLAHESFIGDDPTYPAAGNYGLLDQIRALEWLQANIAQFGGDPDNITLFGQSAGAASICTLMTLPQAEGLFDRAIMQSGYCPGWLRKLDERQVRQEAATEQGARLAQAVGCADSADVAQCLRSKPAEDLVQAFVLPEDSTERPEGFSPILDGHLIQQSPRQVVEQGGAHSIPLVIGVNSDEGSFYGFQDRNMTDEEYETRLAELFPTLDHVIIREYPSNDYLEPWRALADVWGDAIIVCPSRRLARQHRAAGNDVFTYYFTHVDSVGSQYSLGAYHTAELPYVFGELSGPNGKDDDVRLSRVMQSWWTSFAIDGSPGTVDELQWPIYEASADSGVDLSGEYLGLKSNFRAEYCDFWDEWR
ncbi:carboxylesterase family protein [Persicimonas caeni]|uniref:Carboxylic ester hydrolase n=1 Tax=Persicimonas caeni TaxID=2292766 RepID=A0A4Y6Q036_PERCE|nr:carboxylesterase/lipase family protein [Persicimonas caeni]QDG53850.1 carboxylesterase family protein [Persicimonas caeni]QED35071.1 carboxylesterase family protein [Persicimonas caeni]